MSTRHKFNSPLTRDAELPAKPLNDSAYQADGGTQGGAPPPTPPAP